MNDFVKFKRKISRNRKADIKSISPKISILKQLGFKSSGWFDFPTAGKSRLWKKVGEHVFLEVRDIDKAKLLEISVYNHETWVLCCGSYYDARMDDFCPKCGKKPFQELTTKVPEKQK